jgi:tripartite-type tricarboxylate transporter receptor subunit TctC
MHLTRFRALAWMAALPVALCSAAPVLGQEFPNRPIRVVVPYAAGGGTDILARQISKVAAEKLGQQIVIDNRPGAGTTIAAGDVAKADPDGYTLLWGDSGTFALNPHVYTKLSYDPLGSFAPVTLTVRGMLALSVASRVPVTNVEELIAYVRARPGKLFYGTPGNGTPHHLAMESFRLAAGGLSIQHVPYKGEAPAMHDLVGGTIDMMFSGVRLAKAQREGGKVNTLAVSGTRRNPVVPELATLDEAGVKGFSYQYWHGLVAPAGTPPKVIGRLNAAFVSALNSPELSTWIRNVPGAEPAGSSPEEMRAHMAQEFKSAGELARAINLKLD